MRCYEAQLSKEIVHNLYNYDISPQTPWALVLEIFIILKVVTLF